MEKIIFFADATVDAPLSFYQDNKDIVEYIGLRYAMNGEDNWYDGKGSQADFDKFYGAMRKGSISKTSLVTYEDAHTAMKPYFEKGYNVMHFGLSSGLAHTYKNAFDAGTDLAKEFGTRFYCPDTLLMSSQNYLLLKMAVAMHKAGKKFDEITKAIEDYYPNMVAFFTVDDLKYLQRGGRISNLQKMIGTMLNIKPVLATKEGKIVPLTKKKGRKASIAYLASMVETRHKEYKAACIMHADCIDDANELRETVLVLKPDTEIEILNVGHIIGSHSGPGTLGFVFAREPFA